MKINTALVIVALLLPVFCSGQLEYTDTTNISELRKTTTVFVIPEGDTFRKAAFESAIATSWKLTPYLVIPAAALSGYINKPGYSFFCEICTRFMLNNNSAPAYYNTSSTGKSSPGVAAASLTAGIIFGIVTDMIAAKQELKTYFRQSAGDLTLGTSGGYYATYQLFIPRQDNNLNRKLLVRAMVKEDRQPLQTYFEDGRYLQHYAVINTGLAKGNYLYAAAITLENKTITKHGDTDTLKPDPYWNQLWNPGLFKAYLAEINRELGASQIRDPYTNYADTASLAALANDTLYIPDNVAPCITDVPADQLDSGITDTDITEAYPYPYRFVSSKQLSDLILYAPHPVYFLVYQATGGAPLYYHHEMNYANHGIYRCIAVCNSQKGRLYTALPRQKKMITTINKLVAFSTDDLSDIAAIVKGGGR